MSARREDPLVSRIADTRKSLTAELEKPEQVDEIEKFVRKLELLEGLARARRRRRSILWVTQALALAVITTVLLRFSSLEQVDMSLVAETSAFTFVSGESTRNILPTDVLLTEVTAAGQNIALCTDSKPARPFSCQLALALRLNSLSIHTNSVTAVRQSGSCFEIAMFKGGGSAEVSGLLPIDKKRPKVPNWISESIELHPGQSFSFCPVQETTLHCGGIASLMVGNRLGGTLSEQEDVPALSKASLSLLTTSGVRSFDGADIPHFGGLSNGVAVARLGAPIELSLVGKASRLIVATGAHRSDLMPSKLDWVRGNPGLKTALGLLVALFGALIAVRERWLGELR